MLKTLISDFVKLNLNPRYHAMICEFQKLTGIAVLLNTSFNNKEELVVMAQKDAIHTFSSTGRDVLFIGNFLIHKPQKI